MADLQEILSRLRAGNQQPQAAATDGSNGSSLPFQPQILQRTTSSAQQPSRSIWDDQQPLQMAGQAIRGGSHSGYRRPEVSSPLFSPPTHTPEPMHPSRVISPVAGSQAGTPGVGASGGEERRTQLLSLLKFNTTASTSAIAKGAPNEKVTVEKREIPPQLMGISAEPNKKSENTEGPPKETQEFLLSLLKAPAGGSRPQSQQTSHVRADRHASASQPSQPLPSPKLGFVQVQQPSPLHPPSAASKFTYANPFDALHSSSPLKQPRQAKSTDPSEIHKESVSDALDGIAKKASDDATEALDRATEASMNGEVTTAAPAHLKPELTTAKIDSEQESSWETQEDEEAAREESAHVVVYNFPLLPFRTVTLKLPEPSSRTFAPENLMPIAKHKKAFSQDDRCLATASMSYIVYAQPGTNQAAGKKEPNFGFRVLRQDTGTHQQIFNRISNRVVDVRISPGALDGDDDAALATTDNGSVFWARLPDSEIEFDALSEKDSFIIPPLDTGGDNNPSGGAVKTRARCANKTSKFFALSRGKSVHLVVPSVAKTYMHAAPGADRRIDTQRYFQEHSLVIKAGKSVKDFAFAPDDTCIVTLDKGGKAKFWDLAPLAQYISSNPGDPPHAPFEMSDCLHTIDASVVSSGEAGEKMSVSSVMLLDKGRPFEKGIALRYLLIGLKQNHVLQLWDLGLGKCVQALHFPTAPEDGVDGMLSLSYNPKTGIVAIGNPARNSISFIHLSAPKYNLPPMSQASYVRQLAAGDTSLLKPESTAIMSGIREIRLGSPKSGMELLSLDMLADIPDKGESGSEDETLFELYAAHTRGLTTLSVKKQDLGWHAVTGKVVKGIQAEKEGFITMTPLVENTTKLEAAKAETKEDVSSTKKPPVTSKPAATKKTTTQEKDQKVVKETANAAPTNGVSKKKSEKAESKQNGATTTEPETAASSTVSLVEKPEKLEKAAKPAKKTAEIPAAAEPVASADKAVELLPAPAAPVSNGHVDTAGFSILLSKAIDDLRNTVDEDRRVYDANSSAKQDAILRLVSQTLTDNVEKSLTRIIHNKVDDSILPLMTSITRDTVAKTKEGIDAAVIGSIEKALSVQLRKAAHTATAQALKEPDVVKAIASAVKEQSDKTLEQHKAQVEKISKQSEDTARNAARSQQQAIEKHFATQVASQQKLQQSFERTRKDDAEKIASLTAEVRSLTDAMQKIAEGQLAFQRQVTEMQQLQQAPPAQPDEPLERESREVTEIMYPTASPGPDNEVEALTQLLEQNRWDDATIAWLQSPNQGSLFYSLFSKLNPLYLKHVSPLVALSVSAAITSDLADNADDAASDASNSAGLNIITLKMRWLETILTEVDLGAEEVEDVVAKIIAVLEERVLGVYQRLIASESAIPVQSRAMFLATRDKVHSIWRMLSRSP
ncbi:hypothetical protein K431DRAFT_288085 [Polychaeton citri CBS 116435]|uniref:EDC4-like protein pdc1 beta-propeller domain-containing protein n=1 Tax=Polychaeton citri CBS 116435 TaxID=1314669 RepID=A0A9P4Q4M4_9PEZI|nr:hypothetical protein K431DRAFT_288085 [Polychaeton citri CBS 116435]